MRAMSEQVEIRRSSAANTSLIMMCILAVIACALVLYAGNLTQSDQIIVIAALILSTGGIVLAVIQARKPLAIISDEGITAPFLWGENFVPWEDVERFEVVTQVVRTTRVSYVGIFAPNAKGIIGSDGVWKYLTKASTGWSEVPTLIINTAFIKPDAIIDTLQEFHNEYKIAQGFEVKVPLSDEELLSQGIKIEVPPGSKALVSPKDKAARASKTDRKKWNRPADYDEDLFMMPDD